MCSCVSIVVFQDWHMYLLLHPKEGRARGRLVQMPMTALRLPRQEPACNLIPRRSPPSPRVWICILLCCIQVSAPRRLHGRPQADLGPRWRSHIPISYPSLMPLKTRMQLPPVQMQPSAILDGSRLGRWQIICRIRAQFGSSPCVSTKRQLCNKWFHCYWRQV